MKKRLLSSLILCGAVLSAAPVLASLEGTAPGCGDEVKKPKDTTNPPKSAVPLCGGEKKPETPTPPKEPPKT